MNRATASGRRKKSKRTTGARRPRPPRRRPTRTGEGRGARTACTTEIAKRVARALLDCLPWDSAFRAAGISTTSGWKWLKAGIEEIETAEKQGREPVGVYAQFADITLEAETRTERILLTDIKHDRDWHAKARLLTMRWPERYAVKTKLEVAGPGGGPIPFDLFRQFQKAVLENGDRDPILEKVMERIEQAHKDVLEIIGGDRSAAA